MQCGAQVAAQSELPVQLGLIDDRRRRAGRAGRAKRRQRVAELRPISIREEFSLSHGSCRRVSPGHRQDEMRAQRRAELVIRQRVVPLLPQRGRHTLEQRTHKAAQVGPKVGGRRTARLKKSLLPLVSLTATAQVDTIVVNALPFEVLDRQARQCLLGIFAAHEVARPHLVVDLGVIPAQVGRRNDEPQEACTQACTRGQRPAAIELE